MKKRILALMLACMTILSLTACGGNETETKTDDTNVTADTTVTEDAPMDTPVEKENWTDMVVTIKFINAVGQEYFEAYPLNNMPLYDVFKHYGHVLPAKSYTNETHYSDGDAYRIYSNLEYTCSNPSETETDRNTMVSGIKAMFNTNTDQKYVINVFVLPNNITCGSTMTDVEDAYGEPTSTEVTEDGYTTYIYSDGDKHLELYFGTMDTVEGFNYYIDLSAEYTFIERDTLTIDITH